MVLLINPFRALFLTLSRMPPVLMLIVIIGLAVAVTMSVMNTIGAAETQRAYSDPVSLAVDDFRRHHPRAYSGLGLGALAALCGIRIYNRRRGLKQRAKKIADAAKQKESAAEWLERNPSTKPKDVLDKEITIKFPVAVNVAWESLKQLDGQDMRSADVGSAHWTTKSADEAAHRLSLELVYGHTTFGAKPANQYSRVLNCDAQLNGGNFESAMVLKFHAQSAMDYATVLALIARTTKIIENAMRDAVEHAHASIISINA